MNLKAVLFDLHNTLVYLNNPLTSQEVSEFLLERGYDVYPQSWDAASHYVGMIDYPKSGYRDRQAFLKQILHRLNVQIGTEALQELALLQNERNAYTLFPDAAPAVLKAKQLGMKTAIVTTIPDFAFHSAMTPIIDYFDVIMTDFKAGCEKSNPLMHKVTLLELAATPDEAVMVGDELLVDVKIPKRIGMHTILLDRKSIVESKPDTADYKASTLTEAMSIVEKWHET